MQLLKLRNFRSGFKSSILGVSPTYFSRILRNFGNPEILKRQASLRSGCKSPTSLKGFRPTLGTFDDLDDDGYIMIMMIALVVM